MSISTRVHAVARFAKSKPLGHNASGSRSVSWVGVTAAFASHSIGPSPAANSSVSRTTCRVRAVRRVRGVRQSDGRQDPARHDVLHARVTRKYTAESTASTAASMTDSAVAAP